MSRSSSLCPIIFSNHYYVSGKHVWFFFPVAFRVLPWIPRSIWCVRVINHSFGVLIHWWFHNIQCQCMLPPVIAFFMVRIACFVCPSHQPWLYKQCRRAQWLMWFFLPQHPLAERIHILPNTHKDMHIYNNIATFLNMNMHVSSSIAFNSKYCAVNYQTYLRPTKKIYIF